MSEATFGEVFGICGETSSIARSRVNVEGVLTGKELSGGHTSVVDDRQPDFFPAHHSGELLVEEHRPKAAAQRNDVRYGRVRL